MAPLTARDELALARTALASSARLDSFVGRIAAVGQLLERDPSDTVNRAAELRAIRCDLMRLPDRTVSGIAGPREKLTADPTLRPIDGVANAIDHVEHAIRLLGESVEA